MQYNFKIKNISIHPGELEINVEVNEKKPHQEAKFNRTYILRFNPSEKWSPYEAVAKITFWMSVKTGKDRKVQGTIIRDKMLHISEDEFEKTVYYLWQSAKSGYRGRIRKRAIFRIFRLSRGDEIEEDNETFRIAFAHALFQKDGKKRSYNSYYWLGDYRSTTIELHTKFDYEIDSILDDYSPEHFHAVGSSLARFGEKIRSEDYLLKACKYIETAIHKKKDFAIFYSDLAAALLSLARIRNSKSLFIKSLKNSLLAIKFQKDLCLPYFNCAKALFYLAEIEGSKKLFLKSIEYCKRGIEYNQEHHDSYFFIAVVFHSLYGIYGEIDFIKQACENYRLAIKYNPSDSKYYANLGNALSAIGAATSQESFFEEAFTTYRLAIEHDKENPSVYMNFAISLWNYSVVFNKDLSEKIQEMFFKAYLLLILQKQWDTAIYVGSIIIERLPKSLDERIYLTTSVFLKGIRAIQEPTSFLSQHELNSLKEVEGKYDEVDLIVNTITDKKGKYGAINKGLEDLVMRSAVFLAKEIRGSRL